MDGIIERPKQPEHQFRTIHQFRDYHGVCCDLCSVEISCLAGREGTKSHRSSFAMHESGKRHKVAYSEYLEEWQCYRRDVEIYSRFAVAGQRALWSEQKWLAASKITCHVPWQKELKSSLFDFEHSEHGGINSSKFNQVAESVDKSERLALVLLAFIRGRVTHSGEISLFDVRRPDFVFGSTRPWAQEFFRLISMEGHIISNRLQAFL